MGLGGNNGSTFYTSILAHKRNIEWKNSKGEVCQPDWLGSTVMSGRTSTGKPFIDMYPITRPEDLVISGWDINNANLSEATRRAGVLNYQIEEQLRTELSGVVPYPGIYNPDYIASNQRERANHILAEDLTLEEQLTKLQENIRDFRASNGNLENVVVIWTANTEVMVPEIEGIHDSWVNFSSAIRNNRKDLISPSMIYACASLLSGCAYVNGSPQNTLVPGIRELASIRKLFVAGNDFKTGQTRMKTLLGDFLSMCGIRLSSIASYNHLGNNDGKNLSEQKCFESKEISKRGCLDDVIEQNPTLYPEGKNDPDHCVVIKYMPGVGDSKRAIDEYICDIFMGGKQTISIYNVCEDSLLATPVILDLALLTGYFQANVYKLNYHPSLVELSLFFKAPLEDSNGRVVNAMYEQYSLLDKGLKF